MSEFVLERMCCPECRTEQNIKLWSSVNTGDHPDLKEKMRNGRFFDAECRKCGAVIPVTYPMFYYDPDENIALILQPEIMPGGEGDAEAEKKFTETMKAINMKNGEDPGKTRLVRTPNQLLEKLMIWEKGLDDRIIEIVKKIYLHNLDDMVGDKGWKKDNISEILYEFGEERGHMLVMFNEEGQPLAGNMPEQVYEDIRGMFIEAIEENEDEKAFSAIDAEWADRYIRF